LLIPLTRLLGALRRRLLGTLPRLLLLLRRRTRAGLRLLLPWLRSLLTRLRLLLRRLLLPGFRWLGALRTSLLVAVGSSLAVTPIATIALGLDRHRRAETQAKGSDTRQWDEFHDRSTRT
jgi:hypothetical protein